ncbi:DUF5590 domain-containing protein [Listeria grandensis]|uniref:cell wall elongation regulator TseB-like domain-containing protein n=1 Tax=Listeria grandensis TaxID=1494963 RepID=UPI00098D0175|nr:DUF5590 domain-containing protein [Listeria grandensis]
MRVDILRNRNQRSYWKWIWISIAAVIVVVAGFFIFFYSAQKPIRTDKETALARIDGKVDLKEQKDFYLYNGANGVYYVLTGKNSKGKNIIAWVPKSKKGTVVVKYAADGISKEDAIAKVKQEKNPVKILNVTLGMDKGVPIWEVSYLDKANNLNYYDLDFETGEWYRAIENL